MKTFVLPDTRPYPQSPIKNYLLLNAYQLAHNSSSASRKLSAGQLQTEIRTMLSQNHYINLSLAMTMAPDVGTYTSLIQSVGEVLKAENDNEAQWFALPVVLVAGCKKEQTLPLTLPTEALFACLQNYPNLRTLTQNTQNPFRLPRQHLPLPHGRIRPAPPRPRSRHGQCRHYSQRRHIRLA